MASNFIRKAARQKLEQDDAERIDIASDIEFERIGRNLFRAHVSQRSDQTAEVGVARGISIGIGDARHAEIEDFRISALIDKNIPGLEVAMDDAALVRMMNGIADPGHDIEALARGQETRVRVGDQRFPANELHGEIRLGSPSAVGGAGLIDLGDPWMLQAAQRVRFDFEAPKQLGIRQAVPDNFERHRSARMFLLGLVYSTHRTLPEQAMNSI